MSAAAATVVAILREQLAAVEREGRPVGGGGPDPARVGRCELQPVDVDHGREGENFVPELDRLGAERPARHVHRLVQVVRCRGRAAVTPQHVHRLLAMEPVLGREREQLDELSCLLQAPGRLGHGDAVDGRREAAEQGHADVGHLRKPIPPRGRRRHPDETAGKTAGHAFRPSALRSGKAVAKARLLACRAEHLLTRPRRESP